MCEGFALFMLLVIIFQKDGNLRLVLDRSWIILPHLTSFPENDLICFTA